MGSLSILEVRCSLLGFIQFSWYSFALSPNFFGILYQGVLTFVFSDDKMRTFIPAEKILLGLKELGLCFDVDVYLMESVIGY